MLGGRTMSPEEQAVYAGQKNGIYIDYIKKMGRSEILPGVTEFLTDARKKHYQIALGSASRNTALILERLGLTPYFDAVVDGTKVTQAKPDPQVFLRGAAELGASPADCIVFEDAAAGYPPTVCVPPTATTVTMACPSATRRRQSTP